jgi:ZIP family zinc transporter
VTLNADDWSGVIAAAIAAGVSTLGLLSMMFVGDWGRRHSPSFSAFAVGFLLIAIFFHLLPETLGHSTFGWAWLFAGFIGVAFISLSFSVMAQKRPDGRDIALGYASIIALGAHSFIDGLAYETTFRDNVITGSIATFGLLLHEFPEAVIAYFLMRDTGMGKYRAGFVAFIAASLTTVVGALLVAFALPDEKLDLPLLIGLAAGGLLYITIFHLGWHARLAAKGQGYRYASLGVTISLIAVVLTKAFAAHAH